MRDLELYVIDLLKKGLTDVQVVVQDYQVKYEDKPMVVVELVNDSVHRYEERNVPYSWDYTFVYHIITSGSGAIDKGRLITQQINDIMESSGIRLQSNRRMPEYQGKNMVRYVSTYRAKVTKDLVIY